jgi:hypothetical protein
LALLLVLGWWGVKSAWGVSHLHSGDPRELMIGQTTAPDLRKLVGQVEMLSLNRAGDLHTLPVAVDGSLGPAMDWALREFDRQAVLETLSGPPEVALTETLGEDDPGPGVVGASYQGEVFPFQVSWQPADLSGRGLVRWLLYGTGTDPVRDREVTLWVRISD